MLAVAAAHFDRSVGLTNGHDQMFCVANIKRANKIWTIRVILWWNKLKDYAAIAWFLLRIHNGLGLRAGFDFARTNDEHQRNHRRAGNQGAALANEFHPATCCDFLWIWNCVHHASNAALALQW